MRTQDEIIKDYKEACGNNEMKLKDLGYVKVYEYKNSERRAALRQEYIETLSDDKQLAIYLHKKLCNMEHEEKCTFYYEINGIVDDWDRCAHKKYLKKAQDAKDSIVKAILSKSRAKEVVLENSILETVKIVLDNVM